jgi:titin
MVKVMSNECMSSSTPMMSRFFRVVVIALMLFVTGGQSSAAAQQYPPSGNALTVSKANAATGETIALSGDGFAPGSTITITIESTSRVLGNVVADPAGAFTADVIIPAGLDAGLHTLKAIGTAAEGGELTLSASVTVVPSVGGRRPSTGSLTGSVLSVGVAVLLVAAVLIAVVRRRHTV